MGLNGKRKQMNENKLKLTVGKVKMTTPFRCQDESLSNLILKKWRHVSILLCKESMARTLYSFVSIVYEVKAHKDVCLLQSFE